MKFLILLSVLTLLGGCGADEQNTNTPKHAASTGHRNQEEAQEETNTEDIPPSIGMTKSQIRARYGKPDEVYVTPHGEAWSYDFSPPGFLWQIPGYGLSQMFSSKKGHHLHVAFDENGRVKNYNYDEYKSSLERMF